MDPSLDEPSMILYLLRTYVFRFSRPAVSVGGESAIGAHAERRAEAEAEAA